MSIGRPGVGLEPQGGAPPPGAPSAAAVLAWARARDRALAGLVHALSNRVGTVAAVGAMLAGADAQSVGTAARVLDGEAARLEALLALFRLVTADPFGADAAPEPVHVGELLAEVVALAGYAAPDVSVRVEGAADVPPVVAGRAALAQALLAAAVGPDPVVLTASAGGGAVCVRVAGASTAAAEAGAWLLAPSGGAVTTEAGAVGLSAPALGGLR